MSTATPAERVLPYDELDPKDPFRYGFRYEERTTPEGRTYFVQVPLTLYDLMHPREDDKVMNGSAHDIDRSYLKNVFTVQVAPNPAALVLSDCGVYWDKEELGHHSPDISLIFGIRQPRQDWSSFSVAEEGVRPRVLMEITSPSTRKIDLPWPPGYTPTPAEIEIGNKWEQYYQAGVEYYIIVEARRTREAGRTLTIHGYRRGQTEFVKLPNNERGWFWVEDVGIWIGAENGRVVCYDAQGRPIPDYTQLTEAFAQKEAQRQAEAAARQRVEQEKQQLEVEKQRAEREKQQAEQEKQRAERERQQVEREKQQAEAQARMEAEARARLEAQLKAMQAELERLKGAPAAP
jgi:ABC-type Fe3+/spermidine/putrescine transport system ATPase subunit